MQPWGIYTTAPTLIWLGKTEKLSEPWLSGVYVKYWTSTNDNLMKNYQYFQFEWRNLNCIGYRIQVKLTEVIKSPRNGRRIIGSSTLALQKPILSPSLGYHNPDAEDGMSVFCLRQWDVSPLLFSVWFKSSLFIMRFGVDKVLRSAARK